MLSKLDNVEHAIIVHAASNEEVHCQRLNAG
jgi:hypothetical protein